mgnify:FL=1
MLPFDPRQMAMNLISQNPNIANNPNAQEFIKVIQNGDSERGQQIADNLCQSYGMTRDEALKSAKSFFNLPF